MKNISSSPQRGTFQQQRYMTKLAKDANDQEALDMIDFYQDMNQRQKTLEQSKDWQQDNLEYDLRTTEWICAKVKNSKVYAQNLYAAMCNNDFQKIDVVLILQDKKWSCSWRHAGGIIADMREEGDYIDWYCSGIRDIDNNLKQHELEKLDNHALQAYNDSLKYVSESHVTEEIHTDLKALGWSVSTDL